MGQYCQKQMNYYQRDDQNIDGRYTEVMEELKRALRQGNFRAGELLTQVRDERLFGRWDNFKNYLIGELRIAETHGYRLMFAYEMNALLLERKCRPPENERQLRPLRMLQDSDLKVLAWQRACEQKQGTSPRAYDVMREVKKLLDLKVDEETDKFYRAFRQAVEMARQRYAKAHQMLEEGDLEVFLSCDETKAKQQRKRLIKTLSQLSFLLAEDADRLENGDAPDEHD